MTNDKMFDEIGCPDELKKCRDELKRHKKHIEKLSNQLLDYERIIEEKENEIIIIKKNNLWHDGPTLLAMGIIMIGTENSMELLVLI